MAEELEFENCDTATVFSEVGRKAESQEARSLWNRLLPEIERSGVESAVIYLEGEFDRIAEHLERELAHLVTDQ